MLGVTVDTRQYCIIWSILDPYIEEVGTYRGFHEKGTSSYLGAQG